jgi:hypothetical protein
MEQGPRGRRADEFSLFFCPQEVIPNRSTFFVTRRNAADEHVGRELWPEKTVEQAQTLLLACLNSERKERLTPDQVLLLLRKARQADCHAAMEFIGQHAGYEVKPIRPQDEAAELIQRADAVVREARSVAAALERLTHPPLRSIGGDKG